MRRLLPLLLMITGCAMQSSETLPEIEATRAEPHEAIVPTTWNHASTHEPSAITPWWSVWNDAVLNDLIAQALTNNPDTRIADARLNEIRALVADPDSDEQAIAPIALLAAENDAHVTQLEVTHAIVTTYADVRLAEQRSELLKQRMQLARDLTARLHRRLEAGLIRTRTLREAEQTEIETHQAAAKAHHDVQQASAKLALLTGTAPIEFNLAAGNTLLNTPSAVDPDLPAAVIARRPDVQAAWQRLLAASTTTDDPLDDLPLMAGVEQVDTARSVREMLYQKAVLAALQSVESALAAWRASKAELKSAQAFLEIQTANVRDSEREIAAGRLSQIDLLKASLAENIAQENVLLAQRAQRIAFAAAQLALARD